MRSSRVGKRNRLIDEKTVASDWDRKHSYSHFICLGDFLVSCVSPAWWVSMKKEGGGRCFVIGAMFLLLDRGDRYQVTSPESLSSVKCRTSTAMLRCRYMGGQGTPHSVPRTLSLRTRKRWYGGRKGKLGWEGDRGRQS